MRYYITAVIFLLYLHEYKLKSLLMVLETVGFQNLFEYRHVPLLLHPMPKLGVCLARRFE